MYSIRLFNHMYRITWRLQIISAIGYAHNQHICHRDLKLENILLKAKNLSCVKVADFGLSAFYRPGAHMKSSCGTLSFLAPEVFAGTSNAGVDP